MEFTQEEYEQAPILATADLLGTKRSRILDEGERENITFNKYDFENVGLNSTVEHFHWMNNSAAEKGDALISYVVNHNGSDLLVKAIEHLISNFGCAPPPSEVFKILPSFKNLDQSLITEIIQQVWKTSPAEAEAPKKSSYSGIRQLLIGNFFSFHQAENLDDFNDDPFLQQQVEDVLLNKGNADAFPVYFAEYEDNTFALVFSYLDSENEKIFVGSLKYKMRQKEMMNDSFIYNDAHPVNDVVYTSTLTLTKNMVDNRGSLMVYKQDAGELGAIRLVGFLKGVVNEEDVLGSREHRILSDFFRGGYLMEEEHSA